MEKRIELPRLFQSRLIYETLIAMHQRSCPGENFAWFLEERQQVDAAEWRRIWIPREPPESKLLYAAAMVSPEKYDKRFEQKLSDADHKRIVVLRTEHAMKMPALATRFDVSKMYIRRVLDEAGVR